MLFDSRARGGFRALTPARIEYPVGFPRRGIKGTEESRLLGPMSKRREKNLRWRKFAEEIKKLYPPLQVVASRRTGSIPIEKKDHASVQEAGARPLPFQDLGIFEEVEKISSFKVRSMTRRERKALGSQGPPTDSIPHITLHPESRIKGRFLRRRYRQLLDKIPILKYAYGKPENRPLKPSTFSTHFASDSRVTLAEPADLEWIAHVRNQTSGKEQ